MWQRVTKKPTFCLVRDVAIILDSMAFITTKNGVSYLLLVLNSKLIYFYIDKITHQYSDKGFLLSNQFVERIPILMDKDINSKFYYFLSEILVFLKGLLNNSEQKANELSDFFEKIADFMVYGLYFKEEMVKDGSYINEEVEKLIVAINESSKEEKIKKIEEAYNKMKSNPTIQKALNDCQVKEIQVIENSLKKSKD